jgi:ABC-type anion transport system duplicated permease subunit
MTATQAISRAVHQTVVRAHAAAFTRSGDLRRALMARLDIRDERGDVAPLTIGIAIMAALALAVGAIITKKVTDKANTISLDGP